MKITTNYALSGRSQNIQPNFKANITSHTREILIREAKNSEKLPELLKQLDRVKNWGSPKSFINSIITPDRKRDLLVLNNYHLSNEKSASLGVHAKDSVLKQFLSLKEENIVRAQNSLSK